MSSIATTILHTPWDCRWSRFGRTRARANADAEGLWVCVYRDGPRRAITVSACETCPHWEYAVPCSHLTRAEQRIDAAIRVVSMLAAVLFAGTGFVILTSPLAIPFTISLWIGALTCFLLGIWGNFNRRAVQARSW